MQAVLRAGAGSTPPSGEERGWLAASMGTGLKDSQGSGTWGMRHATAVFGAVGPPARSGISVLDLDSSNGIDGLINLGSHPYGATSIHLFPILRQ